MAINREQLKALPVNVRKYATETLPDGSELRGRTLLRSDYRKQRKFLQDKKGEFDKAKSEYIDDVFFAFRLCDDNGDLLVTPEEALAGFFDDWNDDYVAAATRLLAKLRNIEPKEDERQLLLDRLRDEKLDDADLLLIAKQIRNLDKQDETLDKAIKNSDETPGNVTSGVSAESTIAT